MLEKPFQITLGHLTLNAGLGAGCLTLTSQAQHIWPFGISPPPHWIPLYPVTAHSSTRSLMYLSEKQQAVDLTSYPKTNDGKH